MKSFLLLTDNKNLLQKAADSKTGLRLALAT